MFTLRRGAGALAPLAMLLSGTALSAQDAGRMDQAVAEHAEDKKYMGTALVAIGDEVLLDKGYGSANLEWDIANRPDTKFRLGSITKQFTAVSILLLHERGELDINAPVKTYWSDAPAAWDDITVAHLIHHTSGIPSITSFDDFPRWKYQPWKLETLVGKFAERELEFEPGSQWKYSNSGYLLLSAIVGKVTGEPLGAFMQANIFDPLGMANTGVDDTDTILPKRASGYSPSEDGVINADYVSMTIPTGGGDMYSTTGDLLKWQQGLFGGKLLKPETLQTYLAPVDFEAFGEAKYAAGVLVEDIEGQTVYFHGGGIEGFNTWLGHDPAKDITVVVLANLNGGSANQLGRSLMTLAQGGEIKLASELVEIPTDDINLDQYAGTYRVTPQFAMTFFVEDGQFRTQATNQPAFPVFASGDDEFFLKVVDARLKFNRDEDGAVRSVTLNQNGNSVEGVRE